MAKRRLVDVDAVRDEAFALAEDYPPFASAAHVHRKHQLLYAASGTLSLEVEASRWLLPPQRAAWISAGTRHTVTSKTGIALRTVYFAPKLAAPGPIDARVFSVRPLAREMIVHSMRWGPDDGEGTKTRSAFFRALAGLCLEWMAEDSAFFVPVAKSRELLLATAFIDAHVEDATIEDAAAAAAVSARTLARRFEEETQTSFRGYLQAARMMRAMDLLALPRASVTTTAYAVGFRSLGAFTNAFCERVGETPSDYRARWRHTAPKPISRKTSKP